MKHSFRHKNGYFLIDEENIYITITGNRNEAKQLGEQKNKNFLYKNRNLFWAFYIIVVIICVYIKSYVILIIATTLLGAKNLSGKVIEPYKIPIEKLLSVSRTGTTTKLKFRNQTGQITVESFKKIPDNDYEILTNLVTLN